MPILKDIFNPEQIQYLNKVVTDNLHKLKLNCDPERGRDDLPIGKGVRDDIKETVLSYLPEGYILEHVGYSEYNNNHINPNLPKHKDPNYPKGSLTFDYKLDSNIDWPVCIEDECYSLDSNEAILFSPVEQWHYRPEVTFKDEDYVRILFFYLRKS